MGLPAQVQRQKDEADRLWKEKYGKTEKGEPKEVEPKEVAPVVEPTEEPTESTSEPTPTVEVESEVVEPTEEPEPTPGGSSDDANYRHKYDVLQGKYDAEVPRLIEQNKQLQGHSIELSQIIATLQKEVENLKAKPQESEKGLGVGVEQIARQVLTDEEFEDLETVIDPAILGKILNGMIKSNLQPLEQSVNRVSTTQALTAEDKFWEKVNTIPNLEQVNRSPEFNAWLEQKAPYTDQTRRQILKTAETHLDSVTVMEIFGDFAKESGQSPVPATTPTVSGKRPRISPEKGAGGAGVPVQGKFWTVKEVNDFYHDIQKGKYKGKDKERKQKEQDIWNAQKEGRIRQT